jgi:dipeptidyl aminopeptidase/acylaminoacyl peptidase
MRKLGPALILAAALLFSADPALATFPGKNGKIAFGSGLAGVQTVNPDGAGRTSVMSGFDPAWTADGGRLAFVDTHGPNFETDVYVSEADGSNRTQVTHEGVCPGPDACGMVDAPSWSPDGRKIAYDVVTYEGGTYREWISVMDLATGKTSKIGSNLYLPAWSPDGSKIALSPEGGGIAVAHADGTDYTVLTGGLDFHPSWSPDGNKIAFFRAENYDQLYTMNADGTNQVRLTNEEAHHTDPAWSPDGTKIVFTLIHLFSNNDLFTINTDGTGETALAADAVRADWQPIPGPRRSDYKNASKFCKAEREFLGDEAFRDRYGGGANAHGKCVSSNTH